MRQQQKRRAETVQIPLIGGAPSPRSRELRRALRGSRRERRRRQQNQAQSPLALWQWILPITLYFFGMIYVMFGSQAVLVILILISIAVIAVLATQFILQWIRDQKNNGT